MPQLIAVVLIGGVVWYAWRALKREMSRINAEVRDAKDVMGNSMKEVTPLEKGADGVYRPKGDLK